MAYSNRYVRVSPMLSAESVIWAFRQQPRPPPEYIRAVIRSYVDVKLARGKTKYEIDMKLLPLEQQYPQHADQFRAVRAETGLPPSRVLPSTRSDDILRRFATTSSPTTRRPAASSRSNTSVTPRARPAATTTVRPTNPEDGDELPPPPYQRTDPEPEQTRLLEERLAAEALTADTVAADPTPAPPQSAPPASSSSRPPRTSNSPRPSTPARVPSDPEMRQIWEESQFEEAKRASIAAEREREELELAMRLSREEAEASGFGNSQAGPSTAPAITTVFEFEEGDPSPIAPNLSQGQGQGHGRSYSDVGQLQGITNGVSNMPGGWTDHQSSSTPHLPPATPSLLDDDDHLDGPPMLTPSKTGAVLKSKNPFLSVAEREQLQEEEEHSPPSTPHQAPSALPHDTPPPQFTTPAQTLQPADSPSHLALPLSPSTSRQPSSSSLRESPGSSRTQYTPAIDQSRRVSKPLPSPPGPGGIVPSGATQSPRPEQQYAPPSGPPPPHLVIPSSPQGPALPPRRDTQSQGVGYYPSDDLYSPGVRSPSQGVGMGSPAAMGNQGQSTSYGFQIPQQTGQYGQLAEYNSQPQPTQPVATSGAPQMQNSTQPHPPTGAPPNLPRRRVSTLHNGEDPLELLKEYDTVFLIDDSASMAGERWEQAKNALIGVAEIAAEYDEDGIDVYFLNSKRVGQELKSSADVEDLFAGLTPKGATPTGARMETILREYLSRLERSGLTSPMVESPITAAHNKVKPMNLIVITDGAPSDDPESVIITAAKRLDRGDYPLSQIGIQFFQIGNDSEAREALQELDDGLSAAHGVRDMVDTVPYGGEEITASLLVKTLLGGVNRRLDRRGRQ